MSVARAPFAPPEELRRELGKIGAFRLGFEEGRFGMFFSLTMPGSGVQDSWTTWDSPPTARANWTEVQRLDRLGSMTRRLIELMKVGKVTDVSQLVGLPVEITFEGDKLHSWRILTEVL